MSSAHSRLAKALSTGGFDGKEPESSGRKKDKKKRKRSSSSSGGHTSQDEDYNDLMSIFALPPKEFNRGARQGRLDDLTCKQIAVSLSNVAPCVIASDLLAIGGEYEAMMNENCRRLRKSKDEKGKTDSVFEQVTAATGCWRARLGEVAQLLIGKNLTDVTISNAKNLADVTSLLKSLFKSHKRTRTSARFEVESMLARVGRLLEEHEEKKDRSRETHLDQRQADLNDREADLDAREKELRKLERELLAQQTSRPYRALCSTCGLHPCSRDHSCDAHKDGHHNCYWCHKEWKQTGFKSGGKARGAAAERGGKAS
ncbi:unnamed protein product [Symbiodinium necroappetens]|uniref:Uncharacterized protein n=1 Tax=Symbiodinium necroappetens TaxID=1628268 RepID=A0A812PRD0_9DINO|nr:unnamed protein product [Symbiodinium necroappetens]